MPIDIGRAANKFAQNSANAANDYVVGATSAAGIWERNAKSPEAERNYGAGVQVAVQNQLRLKGLANVTAQDYASGVSNNANVYAQKTPQALDKWARNFTPSAAIIDRMLPGMPAKNPASTPSQNYAARGGPIADALKAARLQGIAGGRFTPPPAFGARR